MSYDAKTVRAAARGRWPEILRAFGVSDEYQRDDHGPCPACGGTDRYRFDDRHGNGDWYCNQCGGVDGSGGAGDGPMLLQRVCKMSLGEAINEVGKWLYLPQADNDNRPRAETAPRAEYQPRPSELWRPITPVPPSAPALMQGDRCTVWNPKKEKASTMRPALVTDVRDDAGQLFGYVLRLELPDGKITPQVTYCAHVETGECAWVMRGLDGERPLIGAHLLAGAKPGSTVLWVEGEKTREAALRLTGGQMPVITTVGGSKAVGLSDWRPLAGLKLLAWPDADEAGLRAVCGTISKDGHEHDGIAQLATAAGAVGVRVVMPPEGVPDGWDLADAERDGWTWPQMQAHIRANLVEPRRVDLRPAPAPAPAAAAAAGGAPEAGALEPAADPDPADPHPDPDHCSRITAHVRPLGHDKGRFYYWSAAAMQTAVLSASAHTRNGMLSLAGAQCWRAFFPKGKELHEFDESAAADWMMEACRQRGVYDPTRVRGRGAWIDDGRVVLHLGDRLVVDGRPAPLDRITSGYVYEASYSLPALNGEATADDRQLLEKIATSIRWEMPASAYLLLGWLTLSPICGALTQRPGIWVTGASGAGKSTVVQRLIKPVLGQMLHFLQGGSTTEPGIRQVLRGDALPVLIDEFEMTDRSHSERVQQILELARASYSNDGAKVAKGGASGVAQLYEIQSMFAMASISVGIKALADASRITVLSIRNPERPATDDGRQRVADEWQALRGWLDMVTPELGRRVLARTVGRLSEVRCAVDVFVSAAAAHFGSQRLGDTYGTLMGGAWALLRDEPATMEAARSMLASLNWESYTDAAREDEAESALSAIMQVVVAVDVGAVRQSATLGELVQIATGVSSAAIVTQDAAEQIMARYGLRIRGGRVLIANNSNALAKALADTPFAVGWRNYLQRIPGAERVDAVRFGPGNVSRAVAVPIML